MRRIRYSTYFIAAFVLGAGVLLSFFHRIGIFNVTGVPVEIVTQTTDLSSARGNSILENRLKERLEALLKPLTGKPIWKVKLNEIRASLARDEWVQDVLISRSLPNEVRIRVRPKTAALVFVNNRGDFVPVTDEGALLKPMSAGMLPDVPLLRGSIFTNDIAKRETAVRFAMSLPESGPMSRRNISEIAWSSEDGYSLTLIQPKVDVRLGEDRVELKALRVAQVLSYMSANDLKGRVIDASFSKKVLVRVRKGP